MIRGDRHPDRKHRKSAVRIFSDWLLQKSSQKSSPSGKLAGSWQHSTIGCIIANKLQGTADFLTRSILFLYRRGRKNIFKEAHTSGWNCSTQTPFHPSDNTRFRGSNEWSSFSVSDTKGTGQIKIFLKICSFQSRRDWIGQQTLSRYCPFQKRASLKVVILRCILYYSGSSGRKGGIHVIITEYSVLCIYTLFKKLEVFPSPAGMSLTKLSLAGNN
jgi:hypothetical protein